MAKYADACNLFGDEETVKHKLNILKDHCIELGRDYNRIEKTILSTAHLAAGKMSPKNIIEQCKVYADLGVDHAIFNLPNVHEIKPLEIFGTEIIPEVDKF